MAPGLPPIAGDPVPPLVKHALWARAGGGRATELRSVNPINAVGHIVCRELRGIPDNPRPEDQPRADDCAGWLPAMSGLEYLSNLHVRDSGVERNSFRGGAGSFATMLRLSASWTREDFLNTLAARADFGYGWRGVDAAARGYFGKTPNQLALHEAAMIAALAGEHDSQPWCHPEATTQLRNRILARMHDNGAISDTDFAQPRRCRLTSRPRRPITNRACPNARCAAVAAARRCRRSDARLATAFRTGSD